MYAHHLLAKNAVDAALSKWKTSAWPNNIISPDVYRTVVSQDFPAPDSMLFDPTKRHSIAIEFKPPTENKRGILTGIGQAISYLSGAGSGAGLAYLFSPSKLEGFHLADYLEAIFREHLRGKLAIGLVCYDDDQARDIKMVVDVAESLEVSEASGRGIPNRYWAKHQDMPLHLLWIILNLAYFLPEQSNKREAIWRKCVDDYLFPESQRTTLEIMPTSIQKHDGTPLYILDKTKRKLKRQVDSGAMTYVEAVAEINRKMAPEYPGDNYYNSLKKNFMTFVKHLQLLDDEGRLTEDGLSLHRIGLIHQSTGETFKDYFGRLLLLNGKHLQLILDTEELTRNKGYSSVNDAIAAVEKEFISRGLFKQNPGRRVTRVEGFLKYERIVWGQLGLLRKVQGSQFVPERGFAFDWGQITRLCSLD